MKIVGRNFRTRFGEVDLIAADGGTLCFVEVRARKPSPFGTAIRDCDGVQGAADNSRKPGISSAGWRALAGLEDWTLATVELDHWSRPTSVEFIESAVEG